MNRGPCRCGHEHETHQHFRPGSDCGECGSAACGRYRSRTLPGLRLRFGRKSRELSPGSFDAAPKIKA